MHTLNDLRAGKLAGIKRLSLACGLTEFPGEIYTLADTLEILDLSNNQLSRLPDDLPRLHRLRILFCSNNRFTRLPEVLGRCPALEMVGFKANRISEFPETAVPPRLRWLILTDNALERLPESLGQCTRLQKLMLAGNRLTCLPGTLSRCTRLELVRLAANRLEVLPDWLLTLPRLAWLAFAANPFSDRDEAAAMRNLPIDSIAWENLELVHRLGEGASGIIHHAHHQRGADRYPVAVKLFKGEVTSDGLPRSEKAASLKVGQHPGLIPVMGRIERHPEGARGLVMSLIDPAYRTLAQPPSLDSCTRDIYPADSCFTLPKVLAIASVLASVLTHLHASGVMHGDFYAHNLLWDGHSDCLLGDFGAASFLPPHNLERAHALQRIEVRAYGCLLEELLDRCSASPDSEVLPALRQLQQYCLSEIATTRPLFSEIEHRLASLTEKSATVHPGGNGRCVA